MDELKLRVKNLMYEIEFTHLKKAWVERVIQAGVDEADAYKWVAEIGHIVDEYERSLRFLIESLQKTDVEDIAESLDGWVAYTRSMTIWKLEDVMQQLEGRFEKYLPLEPDDDDA